MADEKKPEEKKKKEGMGLKGLFLTGLIFILPLYITFILLKLVIAWLRESLHGTFHLLFELTFGRYLGDFYDRIEWMFLFLIGLPVVLCFIVVVGWAAKNVLGKRILRWAESSVKKVPLLGGIYSSSRQLVDTVFLKGKASYQRVVLVEFPRPGCWMLGFVTGEARGTLRRQVTQDDGSDSTSALARAASAEIVATGIFHSGFAFAYLRWMSNWLRLRIGSSPASTFAST